MGIDLLLLQNDKGGDFEGVCASQKKRFAPEALAHDVLAMYKEWTKSASLSQFELSVAVVRTQLTVDTRRQPSLTPSSSRRRSTRSRRRLASR